MTQVHFVTLDAVRYPYGGVDDHPFCDPAEETSDNGVVSDRQLDRLEADLALVPEDRLIVLNARIPFKSYTDNTGLPPEKWSFLK